jgi:hypothetical protein
MFLLFSLLSCCFSSFVLLEGSNDLDVLPNSSSPGGSDSQISFSVGGRCFAGLGYGPDCSGALGWLASNYFRSCSQSGLGEWSAGPGSCVRNATSTGQYPGGRSGALIFPLNNTFLVFGGFGSGQKKSVFEGKLADAWFLSSDDKGGVKFEFAGGPVDIEAPGVYGERGVESAANWIGGRVGGITWNDGSHQFVALGWGFGEDPNKRGGLSDVWKLRVDNDSRKLLWTWESGPKTVNNWGSHNLISGRYGSLSFFNSLTSCLFVYGGFGRDFSGTEGQLADMYAYGNQTWTLVTSVLPANSKPVYGVLGVEDASNSPGSRYGSAALPTADPQYLYFFGGSMNATQNYADVWRFNVKTHCFTWIAGPQGTGFLGNASWPSGRYLANVFVSRDSVFLASGYGHGINKQGVPDVGGLKDWWKVHSDVTI